MRDIGSKNATANVKFGTAVGVEVDRLPVYPRGVSSLFHPRARARAFIHLFFFASISDYRALSSPHVVELPKIAGSSVLMRELKRSFERFPPAFRFNVNSSQKKKTSQDNGVKKTGSLKRVRMLNTSEYDSGLEPLKKKSKK